MNEKIIIYQFEDLFLFLQIKNLKNLFGEGGVFLFFVFFVFSKTIFFITIKRCFHYFFTVKRIDDFSCFLFLFFVFSFFLCFLVVFWCFHKCELHLTTTSPPTNLFFFLKLLKVIYLHIMIKSLFV